jgi:acetolactate synthase-1/2/3 large subunit
MANLLPENAIVSEEAVSSGADIERNLRHAAPHDLLPVAGGAIGQGLPVAVGAALACPDRKVVALEADGSAMYTPQALWTMAREQLDVTVVLLANRRYRILEIEMRRTGGGSIGPQADALMDLHRPELDWVLLAKGMGVEASRAETTEDFRKELAAAMGRPGPRLIEVVIEQG